MNKNVQKRKRGFTQDTINADVINAALDDILDGVDPSQALANALKQNNAKFDPEYIEIMKRAQWGVNQERVKNLMGFQDRRTADISINKGDKVKVTRGLYSGKIAEVLLSSDTQSRIKFVETGTVVEIDNKILKRTADSKTADVGFQGVFGGQRKFDGSGRGIGNFGKMMDSLYKGQKVTAIKDDQGVRAGEVYTVVNVEEPMSAISEPEDFNRETVYVLQDSSGEIVAVTDCGGLFYNSKDSGPEAAFENKQEAESYGQKLLEEGKISGFYTKEKEGKIEVFTYRDSTDSVASEEEPLKTKIEELIKNRDSARKLGYSGDQYQKEIDKLQKDSRVKDTTKEEVFQKSTGMNAEQRQDFRNKVDVLLDKAEKLRKAGKENSSEYKKLQQEVMSLMSG